MELRICEGRAAFDSEKQNEPVDPEDCFFQENEFCFWDDKYDSLEALIASMKGTYSIYGACDPSMGKQGRGGDDSAIISLLRDNPRRTSALGDLSKAPIRSARRCLLIDDEYARPVEFHCSIVHDRRGCALASSVHL